MAAAVARPLTAPSRRLQTPTLQAPRRRYRVAHSTTPSRKETAPRLWRVRQAPLCHHRPLQTIGSGAVCPPAPPSAGKAGSWLQLLCWQNPSQFSGCHAACPRGGLHNAALCAGAHYGRRLPSWLLFGRYAPRITGVMQTLLLQPARQPTPVPSIGVCGVPVPKESAPQTPCAPCSIVRPARYACRKLPLARFAPQRWLPSPPARRGCLRRLARRCPFPPNAAPLPVRPGGAPQDQDGQLGHRITSTTLC